MNKALFNPPVIITALLSLAATVVISARVFDAGPEPPTLLLDEPMPVPAFEVIDQNGNTITRDSMLGKVWICDFFLTQCTYVCPRLGQTMADIAHKLASDPAIDDVQLVSFSVNPEYDTTEVIKQYRGIYMGVWCDGDEQRIADVEERWVHTRAEETEAFWKLVREGFKLYAGPSEGDDTTPVAHSSKLVLIDRQGNIRGYYDGFSGISGDEMPALFADIRRLVEEGE